MEIPIKDNLIRTRPNPICQVCGTEGKPLYSGLSDRMGYAPGKWDFKYCPNAECKLIWLDPLPIEEDIIKAYETYYTHHEGSVGFRLRNARALYIALKYNYRVDRLTPLQTIQGIIELLDFTQHAWFDHSVLHLPAKRGGKLLEVGFGSGQALEELVRLGWQAEGIDFDEVAVAEARKRGLNVHSGTLQEHHYPDNHFDAIVMSHVIEHIHDPLTLLQECYRVLAQGGKIVLMTPNNQSRTHAVFKESCFALDPPRHLKYFNVKALSELTRQAGFRSLKVRTSSRNARSFYLTSVAIRDTGHYRQTSKTATDDRIRAILFHIREWFELRLNRSVGEEIIIMAEKQ